MASFWQDLRYAFRALRKSTWFAALAVALLACWIPARRVSPVIALRFE